MTMGVNVGYRAAAFKLGYESTDPSGATVKEERPFGLNLTIADDKLSCRIEIRCSWADMVQGLDFCLFKAVEEEISVCVQPLTDGLGGF
jgi:hypothetical protein